MMILVIAAAVAVVWVTNQLLTERFTESTRRQAEVRLALYTGNIQGELQRNQVVPQLLARDPTLIAALSSGDFAQSSQRLISYREEIGAAGLLLLDETGRVVASTDRSQLGMSFRQQPFFVDALRSSGTVFSTSVPDGGTRQFSYSRRISQAGGVIGVIVVDLDLNRFETAWAGFADAVIVTDSEGTIMLSTESRWREKTEEQALEVRSAPNAIQRALRVTSDWSARPFDAIVAGEAVMRQEARIGFQGWRMASFTTFAGVRERVNAFIALEIMAFAVLLAAGFYFVSRRARLRLFSAQKESAMLRQLNAALEREIAERERAERNLEVAEQTLQQSSKLAILGEMSAAVSHELNQPLAAMKTYLAGARLLLQRRRADEALASFHRIDDLIERMGAITKQLKSYARKGGDEFEPIDVRDSVSAALSIMEPQLRQRNMAIDATLPPEPVIVEADRIRLEQVLINLLRNALDATKGVPEPEVTVVLSAARGALVSVQDNGVGIEDLDSLFEPFYTTKAPGDGVGLGLAISSGIVNDLGGRLTAKNAKGGGAVFEVRLPLAKVATETAAE